MQPSTILAILAFTATGIAAPVNGEKRQAGEVAAGLAVGASSLLGLASESKSTPRAVSDVEKRGPAIDALVVGSSALSAASSTKNLASTPRAIPIQIRGPAIDALTVGASALSAASSTKNLMSTPRAISDLEQRGPAIDALTVGASALSAASSTKNLMSTPRALTAAEKRKIIDAGFTVDPQGMQQIKNANAKRLNADGSMMTVPIKIDTEAKRSEPLVGIPIKVDLDAKRGVDEPMVHIPLTVDLDA